MAGSRRASPVAGLGDYLYGRAAAVVQLGRRGIHYAARAYRNSHGIRSGVYLGAFAVALYVFDSGPLGYIVGTIIGTAFVAFIAFRVGMWLHGNPVLRHAFGGPVGTYAVGVRRRDFLRGRTGSDGDGPVSDRG